MFNFGIINIGSYPKPFLPRGFLATFPYQDFWVLNITFPFLSVATSAQIKQHFLFFLFFNLWIISSIPLPFLKNLEDWTPGFLFKANTLIPESSENEIPLTFFDKVLAFLYAFPRNDFLFSVT